MGKGEFEGLVIPVCIQDVEDEAHPSLAAAGAADQAILVHSCSSIGDVINSLSALFDQLHLTKIQATYALDVPRTQIGEAEKLVRVALERLGERVQLDQLRVLPRSLAYAGPLKNTPLLSYFTSFEIPLTPASPTQPQQHLTVWINKPTLPGHRGVALFDTATATQQSGVVPFKTVHELLMAAQLLVASPHMSPSPSPSPFPALAQDVPALSMMLSYAPSPALSPMPMPMPTSTSTTTHTSKSSKACKSSKKATKTKGRKASKTKIHGGRTKVHRVVLAPSGLLRTRQQHRTLHELRTRNVLPIADTAIPTTVA
jgi:hypothetical protein